MSQNYLTISNLLKTFGVHHQEIRRVKVSYLEQLENFSTEGNQEFPIMYCVPQDVLYASNADAYTFRVYCLDLLQKDRSNETNVLNTTSQVLRDLTNWLKEDLDIGVPELLNEPRAVPVNNFLMDFTAGWYADFSFESNAIISDCIIPFDRDFNFTGVTCDIQRLVPWLTCETLEFCDKYQNIVNNSVKTNILTASTAFNNFLSAGTIDASLYLSGGTNLSNYFSSGKNVLLGIDNTVYLVGSEVDAMNLGGPINNVFTKFQDAYNRANFLQSGNTDVLLNVTKTTASSVGDLILTADYNTRIRIEGYSFNTSKLGSIFTTAPSGNSFNIGGVNANQGALFSNVEIGNIFTRVTGTTGNAGRFTAYLNSVNLGNIDTSITNTLNTTGNGGNVTLGEVTGTLNISATTIGTCGNITTRARANQTTATAGNVSINAPQYNFGSISTASNNLGGAINIQNIGALSNQISCVNVASVNHIFKNNRNATNLSLTSTGGTTTIQNWLMSASVAINNPVGAKTVTITDSTIGAYISTSGTSTNMSNVTCLQISSIGGISNIYNSTVMGSVTVLSGSTSLLYQGSTIYTFTLANGVRVAAYNSSGSGIDGAGTTSTFQNCTFYGSIQTNRPNLTLYNTTTQTLTLSSTATNARVFGSAITILNIPTGNTAFHSNSYIPTVNGGGRYLNLEQRIDKTIVSATTLSAETIYLGGAEISTLWDNLPAGQVAYGDVNNKTTGSPNLTFNDSGSNLILFNGDPSSVDAPGYGIVNDVFSTFALYEQPSGKGGFWTGTTIPIADKSFVDAGIKGIKDLVIAGSNIYNFIGTESANTGTKLDQNGFRVAQLSDLHTANTYKFQSGNLQSDGTRILSAGTDLYQIFSTGGGTGGGLTYIQNGLNTYTGGTPSSPTVNISAATLDNAVILALSASSISALNIVSSTSNASTLFSGGTNLYNIFQPLGGGGGGSTTVQAGQNIFISGTVSNPIVSVVDSPSFANISFSGVATGNDGQVLLSLNNGTGQFITGNGTELSISDSAFQVALNGVPSIRVDDGVGAIQLQNYEVQVDELIGTGIRNVVAMANGVIKPQSFVMTNSTDIAILNNPASWSLTGKFLGTLTNSFPGQVYSDADSSYLFTVITTSIVTRTPRV